MNDGISLKLPENPTPSEAVSIQKGLRQKVNAKRFNGKIKYIAGADVSFNRGPWGKPQKVLGLYSDFDSRVIPEAGATPLARRNKFEEEVYAGIIVLSYPELKVVDHSIVKTIAKFPYIPGLLSFREIPALLLAWKKLKTIPDLVMVDGQGICHPRRLGIATHFGLAVDIPTIGAAKSLLTGVYEMPEFLKGNYSYIYDRKNKSEIIGAALVTKDKVKPMIVSPGHKIDLEQSIETVLKCSLKHRLPEPTRLAHLLVNRFRLGEIDEDDPILPPRLQDPLF